jgi:DNA-binding HxlR family transcriptional regulator
VDYPAQMRSYDQYCAVAKALAVVGDRWTLLIVRELLIRQPCRYTDLQFGLPGIATNLLADRLRQLEEHGLIVREAAPPPIATTVFRLTTRGEALQPVLTALGEWGVPLLQEDSDQTVFRSHWLALPLRHLRDHTPEHPPVTIEVHTADQPMLVRTVDGNVLVEPGTDPHADATITGSPRVVLELFLGGIDLETAQARGLVLEGDAAALARVTPHPGADIVA